MHENQILDIVESVTLNNLSLREKSLIVADVKNEISNTRLAGNITSLVLSKINDLSKGMYRESQATLPKIFQDFSESEGEQKPFEIRNTDEIGDFLNKMTEKKFDGDVFSDTYPFYHPTDVMRAEGNPQHRSDFNVKWKI